jgi:hypothetical protein
LNRSSPRGPDPAGAHLRHLLLALLIGAFLGGAAGFFAYPFLYHAEPGNPTVGTHTRGAPRTSGQFTHADAKDRTHYGMGSVTLYDDRVVLGDDFEVGPGPRFHLYLVPERGIDPDTRVEETMFVDLGPLNAFSGSQAYPLPRGLDPADYGSIVVWCEQFNSLISAAELNQTP